MICFSFQEPLVDFKKIRSTKIERKKKIVPDEHVLMKKKKRRRLRWREEDDEDLEEHTKFRVVKQECPHPLRMRGNNCWISFEVTIEVDYKWSTLKIFYTPYARGFARIHWSSKTIFAATD
uniref:Uncharacterized protein n=1 Tax=Cucumis melo TaxID=3656 RepID=A0A9I9E7U6_CUCME